MKEFFRRLFGSDKKDPRQSDSPPEDNRKEQLVAIFNAIQSGAEANIIGSLETWVSSTNPVDSAQMQEHLVQLNALKQEKILGNLSLQDFLERYSIIIQNIHSHLLHTYTFTANPTQQILNRKDLKEILTTTINRLAVPPFPTEPPFEEVLHILETEYNTCLDDSDKTSHLFSLLSQLHQLTKSRSLGTLHFADDALHTHQVLSSIWRLFGRTDPSSHPSSPFEAPVTQELSAYILLEQLYHNQLEKALQMIMSADRTDPSTNKQANQMLEPLEEEHRNFQASRLSFEAYRIGRNKRIPPICEMIDSMYPFFRDNSSNHKQHIAYFKEVKKKLNSGALSIAFGSLGHILSEKIPVNIPILLVHSSTEKEIDVLLADKKISEREHLIYRKRAQIAYLAICNEFLPEEVQQETEAINQATKQAEANVPDGITLEDAKAKIAAGEIGLALLYVDKILVDKYGRNHPYLEVILLRSQFSNLEQSKKKGIMSEDTYLLHRNQLKNKVKVMMEGMDLS